MTSRRLVPGISLGVRWKLASRLSHRSCGDVVRRYLDLRTAALLVMACSIPACGGSINSHSATWLFTANAPGAAPVGHLDRLAGHGSVRLLVRQDDQETNWPVSTFFRALGPLQQCARRATLFTETSAEMPATAPSTTTYNRRETQFGETDPQRVVSQSPLISEGGRSFTHRH